MRPSFIYCESCNIKFLITDMDQLVLLDSIILEIQHLNVAIMLSYYFQPATVSC